MYSFCIFPSSYFFLFLSSLSIRLNAFLPPTLFSFASLNYQGGEGCSWEFRQPWQIVVLPWVTPSPFSTSMAILIEIQWTQKKKKPATCFFLPVPVIASSFCSMYLFLSFFLLAEYEIRVFFLHFSCLPYWHASTDLALSTSPTSLVTDAGGVMCGWWGAREGDPRLEKYEWTTPWRIYWKFVRPFRELTAERGCARKLMIYVSPTDSGLSGEWIDPQWLMSCLLLVLSYWGRHNNPLSGWIRYSWIRWLSKVSCSKNNLKLCNKLKIARMLYLST